MALFEDLVQGGTRDPLPCWESPPWSIPYSRSSCIRLRVLPSFVRVEPHRRRPFWFCQGVYRSCSTTSFARVHICSVQELSPYCRLPQHRSARWRRTMKMRRNVMKRLAFNDCRHLKQRERMKGFYVRAISAPKSLAIGSRSFINITIRWYKHSSKYAIR